MLKNRRKSYFYESVTDGPTDQRTGTPSYTVASTRLKTGDTSLTTTAITDTTSPITTHTTSTTITPTAATTRYGK